MISIIIIIIILVNKQACKDYIRMAKSTIRITGLL